VLTGTTLLGLAIAGLHHQAGFAQSDPFLGTWQLNLSKSKFSPGPPQRSATANIQADGQNLKATFTGTGANGNPFNVVIAYVFDGMPHSPTDPSPTFDATAYTRVDAYTLIRSVTKAAKLVGIQSIMVSSDGKTLRYTGIGTDANGRPINNIAVYDKQ
jgi:hypothetical protein